MNHLLEELGFAFKIKRKRRKRAHLRLRNRVEGTSGRPRLSVFKSLRYIYAQVIDDQTGRTLAQASSAETELKQGLKGSTGNVDAARRVGETVAERAKSRGLEKVVFDRGGAIYHGKIKAVADGKLPTEMLKVDTVKLNSWARVNKEHDGSLGVSVREELVEAVSK